MFDDLTPHVQGAIDAGVLTMTFNRPEKKNALTQGMYKALNAGFARAADDTEIGAVLLRGVGGVFTAGNDLKDFMASDLNASLAETMALLRGLASFDVPLVAAVDGAAIGIGTTILLHCDFVYATPSATFKTPFIDLALAPEAGSSLLMPAMLGATAARRFLMLGDTLEALDAASAGLVSGVYEDADAKALETAQALAAKPHEAMRTTKQLMRDAIGGSVAAAIDREGEMFRERLASAEAQAQFAKFFAKPT